jgi:hypothetical protein
MKDKITIDGVDVSGCKSFYENYGEYWQGNWQDNDICYLHSNHCSDNPDCYYKQLLTEQAKNKKLVEALEEIIKNHREAEMDIFSLTQPDKGDIFCKFYNTLYIAQQALNEVNK